MVQGFWHQIGAARTVVSGPHLLAFVPAASLAAFWIGGELALLSVALGAPVLIALAIPFHGSLIRARTAPKDRLTGLEQRPAVVDALDDALLSEGDSRGKTAAIVLEIDEFSALTTRLGDAAAEEVLRVLAGRLLAAMRDTDVVGRFDGPAFAIALSSTPRLDLETLIQLCARLQSDIAEPIRIDRASVYVTASVGFCLSARAPHPQGKSILGAAEAALEAAKAAGAGAIRAYSENLAGGLRGNVALFDDVAAALEAGEIVPWFQPQLSTDTGAVSGFECLARWIHPERGVLAPEAFLPQIEAGGLQDRLNEVIIYHGLTALRAWQRSGFEVTSIAVNFSAAELRNPALVDRLKWEFDRFETTPEVLSVEIKESVIAAAQDDFAVRNLAALAALGCQIVLDDFGTGQAALANIQRFSVRRIKLDRSFVARVDRDRDQQRMVSGLISLAERLGLEALAEGVETVGEHAMVAQYGCGFVQGFGIARPMPFEDTLAWLDRHRAKLAAARDMGQTGTV